MTITFSEPGAAAEDARHHHDAAAENIAAAESAIKALSDVLNGAANYDKILLRAAAGAGKSYALVRMVKEALDHPMCSRVGVTAFANKQVFPLAGRLGSELGAERVCLFVAAARRPEVPQEVMDSVTVATTTRDIPPDAAVVLGVSHKLGARGERGRLIDHLDPASNGDRPFDVLMVDEAWQLALHRFTTVEGLAPIAVGVGDVGQLPPIDPSQNPWRGDPGYNPYRAWPTAYENADTTFSVELPAVWRPAGEQLPLWRAFYGDWDRLDCVAAPGDRSLDLPPLAGAAADVWNVVASGHPTLLEVEGLEDPEAADIDQPLLQVLEDLLIPLLEGGFTVREKRYDGVGNPQDDGQIDSQDPSGDPLIVILAPEPGRRRRDRHCRAARRQILPARRRDPGVNRRLVARADQQDHRGDSPPFRGSPAGRLQLGLRATGGHLYTGDTRVAHGVPCRPRRPAEHRPAAPWHALRRTRHPLTSPTNPSTDSCCVLPGDSFHLTRRNRGLVAQVCAKALRETDRDLEHGAPPGSVRA